MASRGAFISDMYLRRSPARSKKSIARASSVAGRNATATTASSNSNSNRANRPGGASQQAGELAELQKQIINATWKLIRRETVPKPTAEFGADSRSLAESQQVGHRKARNAGRAIAGSRIARRTSKSPATPCRNRSTTHRVRRRLLPTPLRDSHFRPSKRPTRPCLKLRAHELKWPRPTGPARATGVSAASAVNVANAGSAARRRNSRQQRQLNQLELANDQNRYEMQTRADAPTPRKPRPSASSAKCSIGCNNWPSGRATSTSGCANCNPSWKTPKRHERREELQRELAPAPRPAARSAPRHGRIDQPHERGREPASKCRNAQQQMSEEPRSDAAGDRRRSNRDNCRKH